jgi:hypothetical protein
MPRIATAKAIVPCPGRPFAAFEPGQTVSGDL